MKVISWRAPWWKVCQLKRAQGPVLKIRYHGYHGRGTKGIWGDQRDVYCFFFENIWEDLPQSLFCPLKFSLWSSQNHCSVPSNSVYSPPKIFVLPPPNYKSLFPHQNHCYVPSNSAYPVSNSVYSPPKILFCPLLITKNHWSPQKSLFCPL